MSEELDIEMMENIKELEESRENFRDTNDTLSQIKETLNEKVNGKTKLNDTLTELTSKLSEYASKFETSLNKLFQTISKKENININRSIFREAIEFDGKHPEIEKQIEKPVENLNDALYKNGKRVETKEVQESKIKKILDYAFVGFSAIGAISAILMGLDAKDFNTKNIFQQIKNHPAESNAIGCMQLNLETGELTSLGNCDSSIKIDFGPCSTDPNQPGLFCDQLSGMPCPNSYLSCLKCPSSNKVVISPVCISPEQLYLALLILDQHKDELKPPPISTNIIKVISIVVLIIMFILYIIYYIYKYK